MDEAAILMYDMGSRASWLEPKQSGADVTLSALS